jgi:hypothetical protein
LRGIFRMDGNVDDEVGVTQDRCAIGGRGYPSTLSVA